MSRFDDFHAATALQHLGEDEKILGAMSPPIFQTSNFAFDEFDVLSGAMRENLQGPPHHYSRTGNPSLELPAQKIAWMEGAEACILTGSGMGAITVAVLGNVAAGSHVVCVDTCYGPLRAMLAGYLSRFGVTHTFVEGSSPDEVIDAIRPNTTLVYLESPSTFVFRLQDLERIAEYCRERGIVTAIDNTYSTPLYQQPMRFGIDIVIHSCSKYLAGHSDITAGALCTTRDRINRLVREEVNYLGSILHPFQAWLLLRGLRTLPLRLRRHERTANRVAQWLTEHPSVETVHHVGLESFPQRVLRQKQMTGGTGGLFSFEPKRQDEALVKRFCDSLELFQIAVSWGGFESLVVPLQLQPMGYEAPRWIVRLFTGLEESADLTADLSHAFEASGL